MAAIAKQEQAELILCGGQQADWDSHALGAAVAERLSWPAGDVDEWAGGKWAVVERQARCGCGKRDVQYAIAGSSDDAARVE